MDKKYRKYIPKAELLRELNFLKENAKRAVLDIPCLGGMHEQLEKYIGNLKKYIKNSEYKGKRGR